MPGVLIIVLRALRRESCHGIWLSTSLLQVVLSCTAQAKSDPDERPNVFGGEAVTKVAQENKTCFHSCLKDGRLIDN